MQFRDLKTQYRKLKNRIDEAIIRVSTDCNFIMGKQVTELEKKLAGYAGTDHCVTCANGTDALQLALMAWGIKSGDAVFVPDFTFFSSGEVVPLTGATPVFVDVNARTFNIDCDKLEGQIERVVKEGRLKPRVIVAVDLFGLPADFARLREIADKYGMYILEDGAQGFGGEISGRKACSFGDIATTSFFPAKPLGCYGDGGALFTDNDEWADLLKSYRVHGKGANKYDNIRIGLNSRLDTVQAAVLDIKLDAFEEYELEAVNDASRKYDERLKKIVETPYVPDNMLSSWAQYTIKLKDRDTRDDLQQFLKSEDIPSMIYYRKSMHCQDAFKDNGYIYRDEDYKVTVELCDRVLSLPMHPYLSDSDIDIVTGAVKSFLARR